MQIRDERPRLHDCGDGRFGVLEEVQISESEGIVIELTCMSCYTIVSTTFEEYSPEVKEKIKREYFDLIWEERIKHET